MWICNNFGKVVKGELKVLLTSAGKMLIHDRRVERCNIIRQ